MKGVLRIAMYIIYIVVGIVMLVFAFKQKIGSFANGFAGGFAGAMISSSIVMLIREIKCKTNKEYRDKMDIKENDERNRLISMKSWYYAGSIFLLVMGIADIVLMFMSKVLYVQVISSVIALFTVIFLACYVVVSKKN